MPAKSIDRISASSAARISLALFLTVVLMFPDAALAQQTCNPTLWEPTSVSLQNPIETFAAAVATVNTTNYLYVIGGLDCNTSLGDYNCGSGTFQTQVGHAQLNSDGSLGSFTWQNLWSLGTETAPVGLSRDLCGVIYTSPATNKNYIYTVGGLAYDPVAKTSALTDEVWYAQIYPNNGDVLKWHQAPYTLPKALDLQGTVVLNGYLYVIGGSTNNSTPPAGLQYEVYSAQLNPNSGNLMGAAFNTSQPPIDKTTGGIYKTCPVVDPSTSTIYVAGGETGTTPPGTPKVWYTVQGAGGALSTWAPASPLLNDPPKTYPLASQAVVYNNVLNGIILMGGDTTGQSPDTGLVELGNISSASVIDWSATALAPLGSALNSNNGGVIERNAGATNGNFIYSLGGEVTSLGATSDSSTIYCLQVQN
jgi:hypothetical protein